MDERPQAPLRRALIAPAIANVIVQAILVAGDRVPSVDTMAYLETGTSFLRGDGYVRNGMPELHFPPGVPVGLGAISLLLGDELRAFQLWNLAWGLALVAMVVTVAWRVTRRTDVAVLTAWVMPIVGTGLAVLARVGGGSEAPAAVLHLGAALVAIAALEQQRSPRRALLWGLGVGALLGAAYLFRPEVLVWSFLVVVAWLVAARIGPQRQRPASIVAVLAGTALATGVLISPYLVHQHRNTGSWALTAKSREASLESWTDLARNERDERDAIVHAIQPDGTTLGPPEQSLRSLITDDPGGWLSIVAINLRELGQWALDWAMLPLLVSIPAVARLWSSRRQPATLVLGAVALAPVLTCLLYFVLPRYLIVTTAVLVPFGCWALVDWRERLAPRWRVPATGVAYGLLLLGFARAAAPLVPALPDSPGLEHRDAIVAGEWIDEHLPADAVIMTRSYAIQHYAKRGSVILPAAPLDEVIEFGRRRGATHVIADDAMIRSRRPELVDDLLGPGDPEGLELVTTIAKDGYRVRIYEIEDPPTEPAWPLPLGYVSDPLIPRP